MDLGVLVGLALLILSIATRQSAKRSHERLDTVERLLERQRAELDELALKVRRQEAVRPSTAAPRETVVQKEPITPTVVAKPAPAAPVDQAPEKPVTAPVAPPVTPSVATPIAPPVRPPSDTEAKAPAPEPPASVPFDWESLIGVRLFAAIAGIALVIAAVYFLSYSIEHGWLQPKVRVAIGVITAIILLIVCERKAGRAYPITANALDAAAIAILFSTFFSAHSLWDLISATPTFFLLALVTVVAVLLSIRRDSIFIAVLGLLGGFLTPALLSSGQNEPVGLFSYLLLLNIGLAWVAYRKRWPILTMLSAALTTFYQWGWVLGFLQESSVSLAMGIFLIFPLAAMAALMLGNRRRDSTDGTDQTFERTGLIASALPLVFGVYLAAIPAYGANAGLLFGFLFLVDAGLLAVALARGEERLHLVAATATLLVVGLWIRSSYSPEAWTTALAGVSAFVLLYGLAPALAARVGRPFGVAGAQASYAAPLLLFVFPVLARTALGGTSPLTLFGVLIALAIMLAWRAIVTKAGVLYFIAAFFVLAAAAAWSSMHLVQESLRTAFGLYAAIGLFSIGVPLVARRAGRPLEPAHGAGIVLLASLGLLLFLAANSAAPSAIWGLALLLAIQNAALFVESASGRMPALSIAGGVLSWYVLFVWWTRSAAIVGLVPALLVVALLSFVMLAGHAWTHARRPESAPSARLRDGLFLGLIGQLFLVAVALNPAWALPPWPLFGALAVLTLATSVVALFTRVPMLHLAGVASASIIVVIWTVTAAPWPGPLIAIVAGALISTFALLWITASSRRMPPAEGPRIHDASVAAAVALFIGEITVIAADSQPNVPWVGWIIIAHTANLAAILILASRYSWKWVAPAAVLPAALALAVFADRFPEPEVWRQLLALSVALYAVFAIYPFALGRRSRETRDPFLATVLASGFFLLAAREALQRGGLGAIVGIVPVAESLVLALLLRQLLRLEPPGSRDLGRLALVAGAALAFITVAIPLQVDRQWITIGWALEGAALSWLVTRVPHRGLVYAATGLLAAVFIRLAVNPDVFYYEPRGATRILNWYLYTYAICAVSMILAARWLPRQAIFTNQMPTISGLLQGGAVILLFLLLNIEIADFYSSGPEILFRFGATLAQDLTYTIGWLAFGLALLVAGIITQSQMGRITALALIALTTFKCFLFDLRTLGGLYRVASLVGLAISLALVSILLQKYVLRPRAAKRGAES